MVDRAPPFSARRFRFAWRLFKALWEESKGRFDNALRLLDDAAEIIPLRASDRVYRAELLLRARRTSDAHTAFAALRNEFKGSSDPNRQYLRHYCTARLSLLSRSSGQWSYEAKQAKLIPCNRALKRRFPMVTVDDIYEAIPPRR